MAIPLLFNNDAQEQDLIVESVQEQRVVVSESDDEEESLGEMLENESSFVGKLLKELVVIYSRMSHNSVAIPTQSSRRAKNNSRISGTNNGPSPPQQKTTTPTLPDILCCHAQNLHPIPNENNEAKAETPPQLPRPRTQRSLFGPALTDDYDDLNSELSLDVKMNIDYCNQRIGRDLRQIADQFEATSSSHNQTRFSRHATRDHSSSTEITLKFEFTIKILIPATLVGFCSVLF